MDTDKCGVCNIEYPTATAFCSEECMRLRKVKRILLTDIATISEQYPGSLQVVDIQQRNRAGKIRWTKKVFSNGKAIRMPRKCRKKSCDDCDHPRIKKWIIEWEELQ